MTKKATKRMKAMYLPLTIISKGSKDEGKNKSGTA